MYVLIWPLADGIKPDILTERVEAGG